MAPQSKGLSLRWLPALLLVPALLLGGCRSDKVTVNKKDPHSPQFAYRLHELALLQLAADDIQELEKKKQYGGIYDKYGSAAFQKSTNRRLFLVMANCVENHLGGLIEYDRNDLGFRREILKGHPGKPLDILTREVQRMQGPVEEHMVFVPNGINFKLNSLYWVAKDKQFLQCIADSPAVELSTRPEQPGGEQEQAAGTTQPPAEAAPGTEADEKPDEAEKPATDTVQEMKPAEAAGEDTLDAQPAGAGAIKDIRPSPEKKPAGKTPGHSPESQPNAPSPAPAAMPTPEAPSPAGAPAESPPSDPNTAR